jgi:coenzyme F420-reducing hydrogenase delta subunit/quinol-cytochrome oxidoreductase complex cytochrome b subunit
MTDGVLPVVPPRQAARRWLEALEAAFDQAFGPIANPWHHLGALSFFFFWVVAASGIYVYAAFDTSADGAYRSVEQLTQGQWYLGGVARSLHRYASDAFVITTVLHVLKEFLNGRYSGFRWFSWITGVPLPWLLFAAGIGGYWLVWDRLAQFSLIATTEWLDWLPFFAEPLTRNFLSDEQVTNRFFSLLIFLHIGIPLVLLLGMWVHIQRVSGPDTNPPRTLALGSFAALLLLALVKPAVSHAPADLGAAPGSLQLDWFYLFVHPLMYQWSPGAVWALAGLVTLLLMLLPWLTHEKRQPVAQVSLANCNGCGRCFADCPYVAVVLQPRSDGKPHLRQAVVDADLCAGCGICAGACPSSTPFRSVAELTSGIDMPQLPIGKVRADLERAVNGLTGAGKVVVFGCDCAADVGELAGPNTAVLSLLCTGMLPPSFIEYALRAGADGVLVTGCRIGDCTYRLGNTLTEQRIRGEREPHLRSVVPAERVRITWAARSDAAALRSALEAFRATLAAQPRLAPLRRALRKIRESTHA